MTGRHHATAGLLTVAGLGVIVHAQDFRQSVEGVTVDVLVSRDSVAVTDLMASDFTVRDNGVLQDVQSAQIIDDGPITLFLVLDTSGSVLGQALTQLQAAASSMTALLQADDKVALLTFSQHVRMNLAPPATPLPPFPRRCSR